MWQIYAIYGLGTGVGVGFVYVPAVGVVQRWFVRKRGLASGIAVTGIGLGTLCMPAASAVLIHWSDWRTAYLVMSLFVFAFGIIAALLIVESPEKLGLHPDGDSIKADPIITIKESPSAVAAINSQGISLRDALQTRPFWLLYLCTFCVSLGLFIPFVHMVPFSNDLGLPTAWVRGDVLVVAVCRQCLGACGVHITFRNLLWRICCAFACINGRLFQWPQYERHYWGALHKCCRGESLRPDISRIHV
jgi:MFS family permease